MGNITPSCAKCGAEVPRNPGRGRPRKYCEACSPRRIGYIPQARAENAPPPRSPRNCSICGNPTWRGRDICTACKWKAQPRVPCVACGGPTGYRLGTKKSPESPTCQACKRARPKEVRRPAVCSAPGCSYRAKARGLCVAHDPQARPRVRANVACECVICGSALMREPGRVAGAVCSTECRRLHRGGQRGIEWSSSTDLVLFVPPVTPIRRPRPRVWFAGYCRVCKVPIVSPFGDSTCSPGCAEIKRIEDRRMRRRIRRAREKGARCEPYKRGDIFERDRCRCWLCGKRVSLTKPVPYPRAATIDHVIPLANGGDDTPANVRTACFLCNAIRSNRETEPVQLALVG